MGCGSSAGAENPGSAGKAGGKGKGCVAGTVTYYYLQGFWGRADPITQLFQYHGQACKYVALPPPEWEAQKARGDGGEFGGGLPQAMFSENGKSVRLCQLGAIMRYFGIRYGYYDPKNWKLACHVDPIIDTWSDIVGGCLLYTSPSPRDRQKSRMPSSA